MPELTPEHITDGLAPGDVQVSPDGRFVAYVVTPVGMKEEHPARAIWVAAADGGTPPRRLTAGVANDERPRWAADSRSLFFLSDRNERGKAQLYRIAVDGGEAEALTEWKGGLAGFAPLPDGATVAIWAKDEPTDEDERREKGRDDARVWGERLPYERLRLLDLGLRTLRTVDGLGDRHVFTLAGRPDDGTIAAFTWARPEIDPGWIDAEIWLVDPSDSSARRLAGAAHAGMDPIWRRGPHGWHLTYLAFKPPFFVGGTTILDLAVTGDPEREPTPTELTPDLPACPGALAGAVEGDPVVLVAEGLDTSLHRLDRGTGQLVRLLDLSGGTDAVSTSADGRVVALLRGSPTEPADVWTGPPSGPFRRISDIRPELREFAWGSQERLSWRASDGLRLDGLLILPPGKTRADGPFPTITLVHGGPYGRFADEFQLRPHPSGQWLATAGYAVYLPNPRGGMGHGHEFAVRVAGRVGLEDWGDIVAGLDRLIDDGVADPDRLGIGGWSQGGFMSAWAVGQTDRFKAAVVGAGPTDWGMMAATSDVPHFEGALGGSYGWEGIGPHPHDAISPISFAHRVTTPCLILHGERDERVPLNQAEFFHRALQERGVPHEYVVYPREPHGIRERNHQLDLLRRVRAWYGRWLGEGVALGAQDERVAR
jgi:dipeptidyl aminopeptidase/acylaminoacyl peptidase